MGIVIPLIVLFLASIACDMIQNMGELLANSELVTFTAKGETRQIWQAKVNSGTTYEVIVQPKNVTGQNDGASIIVCDLSNDICPDNSIIASITSSQNGAKLTFLAQKSGLIYIHVVASIGEKGEKLGTYQIKLQSTP